MKFTRAWLAALATIAIFVAGCAGQPSAGNTVESGNVTISMTEMKFDPSTITVSAGAPVTITLKNEGTVEHNFRVKGMENETDTDVEAGKSADVTFTPTTPGTYDFYCDEPGHEAAGMTGKLIVK